MRLSVKRGASYDLWQVRGGCVRACKIRGPIRRSHGESSPISWRILKSALKSSGCAQPRMPARHSQVRYP